MSDDSVASVAKIDAETRQKEFEDLFLLLCANGREDYCTTILFHCCLRYVNLVECHLELLPNDFCCLSALEECYLSKNKLIDWPNGLHRLLALKILCLDSNNLTYVPTYVDNVPQLETLDLFDNEIMDVFCDIGRLQDVDIELNFIEEHSEVYEKQKRSLRKKLNQYQRLDGMREPSFQINQSQDDDIYEEIWDSDSSWELDFKIDINGRPKPRTVISDVITETIASGRFCPADYHPKRELQFQSDEEYEEGIFDDAEEDISK